MNRTKRIVVIAGVSVLIGLACMLWDRPFARILRVDYTDTKTIEVLPPVEDWHPELREARPLDDPPKPFAQLAGLSF